MLRFINRLAMQTRRRGNEDEGFTFEEEFPGRAASIQDWNQKINELKSKRFLPVLDLSSYTQCNVIRLGLETACSHCTAKNWHNLDEVGYEVRCERCLKIYGFPQAKLESSNKNWKYRVVGPFAVPEYARGSYSALLTIKALSETIITPIGDHVNYITGLDLKSNSEKCEIDFALWIADKIEFDTCSDPKLVIGEAKSFASEAIGEKDILKLKIAGEMLPNSIIVISVLKDDFSDEEKNLLAQFVEWAREPVNHKPRHWVILLTGTELFATHDIRGAWKDKGEPHSKYSNYQFARTLKDLAECTQAIYLGMPGYSTWLEQKRRGLRK